MGLVSSIILNLFSKTESQGFAVNSDRERLWLKKTDYRLFSLLP